MIKIDVISWLNKNSGSMTFFITAVYVVATIFICWANIRSANASKAQLNEMRKQYIKENRTNIEVEFLYEKRAFYGLRFVNHGKYTAHNVKILLDSTFIDNLNETDFSDLLKKQSKKSCVIGVGQHYDLFFGTNKYRENPKKLPAKGIILYESNGESYKTDFYIDLENYAVLYSVSTEQEDILKKLNELKKIKQELKKLNHFLSNTNLYK